MTNQFNKYGERSFLSLAKMQAFTQKTYCEITIKKDKGLFIAFDSWSDFESWKAVNSNAKFTEC